MSTYTKFKRFGLSVTQWLAESTTLVALTGHNASAASTIKIFVPSRLDDVEVRVPCLIVDVEETGYWIPDLDAIFVTFAKLFAYANSRTEALDIIGAVDEHAKHNTDQSDKSFDKNDILTFAIKSFPIDQLGQAEFIPDARKRTERSDITVPDRYVAAIGLQILWVDNAT